MPRQSISFAPSNDQWLKAQVESQDLSSKSDVVNDLIRWAREITALRAYHAHRFPAAWCCPRCH